MTKLAFVIGDVHGKFALFQKAMLTIKDYIVNHALDMNDVEIITLGDYIDRGPASRKVVEYLMARPQIKTLRGNHEQMLLDCYSKVDYSSRGDKSMLAGHWMRNGGMETLESYGCQWGPDDWLDLIPKSHRVWMDSLPTFYETEHHYFVHAGLDPRRDINNQDDGTRMWVRDVFLHEEHDFGKHIVHGHTPLFPGFDAELLPYRTNLDVGAGYRDQLMVGVFDLTKPGGPIKTMWVRTC